MPHVTVEYSANLDDRIDIASVCDDIRRAALSTGLFELGAVRVRAIRCEAYSIADAMPQNAFLDIVLKMGAGRSLEARRQAGAAIFEAVAARTEALFGAPHFALSMEVREIDPELSWKKNAMHARLRGA